MLCGKSVFLHWTEIIFHSVMSVERRDILKILTVHHHIHLYIFILVSVILALSPLVEELSICCVLTKWNLSIFEKDKNVQFIAIDVA